MAMVTLPTSTLPLTAEASANIVQKLIDAFTHLFDPLKEAITTAWNMLSGAVNSIAKNIYGAFQWIYNGISYFVGQFVSLIGQVIKAILGVIQWVYNSIKGFFENIINAINSFITSLATRFRQKLIDIIRFDLMFMLTDRLIKKVIDSDAPLSRKIGLGVGGVFANLFISEMVARVIDALLPPAPSSIPVFPTITLPSIDFASQGQMLVSSIQQQISVEKTPPDYFISQFGTLIAIPISDHVYISDVVYVNIPKPLTFSDEITIYDIVSISVGSRLSIQDSVLISDNVVLKKPISISIGDYIGISDSVSVVKQARTTYNIITSDGISISDTASITK
jgi:Flp pilus assembly pilin Flp